MRRLLPVVALSLIALQAQAQQSPNKSGGSETLPGTVAPGSATTGANTNTGGGAASAGTTTTLQTKSKNVSFHTRFMAAAGPDGHLTMDQAKAAKFPQTVKYFSQIDSGNKGYVTYDETVAFFRAKQNPMMKSKGK